MDMVLAFFTLSSS